MKKKFLCKCLISLGLLLFFTFLPQIMQTPVSIARASEIEKEKNNEYRLNLRTITLVNGKSYTLKVYNLEKDARVTFRSADPEIASVNDDGTLTANKVGSTTITATVRRGLNSTPLTCEVTIGPPAFSVKLTRPMVILGLDQSFLLETVMKPANTAELAKFSSFDSTIASVTSGGRVTAKDKGMTYVFAEIDASYQDGRRKFSTCSVIIINQEDVPLLDDYFKLHTELTIISEAELSSALFDFFNNQESSETASVSEESKTQKTAATDISPKADDTAAKSTLIDTRDKAANTGSSNGNSSSELSLVEALDKYLNSKFDMAGLRQKYNEIYQIAFE